MNLGLAGPVVRKSLLQNRTEAGVGSVGVDYYWFTELDRLEDRNGCEGGFDVVESLQPEVVEYNTGARFWQIFCQVV